MAKRKGRNVNGVLLVDKPQGMSSNDVVQHIRRAFKASKAGHTGALDPLATGLLPVCLGEATKFSQYLLEADKAYFVTAQLGERTDTSDADGEIIELRYVDVTIDRITAALEQFKGEIEQVPSMYSALKFEGKPLYYYARKGINIDRPARPIHVYKIEFVSFINNELSLNIHCSKGTYIRTIIDDLGQVLGCGAHVKVLRRTMVGHYDTSKMLTLPEIDSITPQGLPRSYDIKGIDLSVFEKLDSVLLSIDTPISTLPSFAVDAEMSVKFNRGQGFEFPHGLSGDETVRVYGRSKDNEAEAYFLGVATATSDGKLQAKRVVVY